MLSQIRLGCRRVVHGVMVATLLLTLGCGPQKAEVATVSGQVTFDGVPIESGKIRFSPLDDGRPAETLIQNGAYSVEIAPGEIKVFIDAYKTGPPDETGVPTQIPFLPETYNSKSELIRTISPAKEQVLDFALTTSGEAP